MKTKSTKIDKKLWLFVNIETKINNKWNQQYEKWFNLKQVLRNSISLCE